MSLGRLAAVAAVWSAGARILTQVVQFGVSAALAHLLAPADFGVVGAAVVFTGLAGLLADAGLGASLVQAETHSAAEIDGVFWLSSGAGLLAAVVCWLVAPWVGSAYGSQDVVAIVHGIAPMFLLVGCSRTPQALLQRRMDFFRLA